MFMSNIWIYFSVFVFLSVTLIQCGKNKDPFQKIEDNLFEIEENQTEIRNLMDKLKERVLEEIKETVHTGGKSSLEKDDDISIEPEDPALNPEIKEFVKRLDIVEKNIDAIQSYVDGEKETDDFLKGLRGDIGKAFDNDMLQVRNLAENLKEELNESLEKIDHDLKAVEDFANSRNVIIGGVLYYDGIGSACGESFDECRVHNSECRDGKCQCKPGMSHDSLQENCVMACADGYGIRNGRMPHITQIAAQEVDSGCEFCRYIMPKEPVSKGAAQITEIFVTDGKMIVKIAEVDTCSLNHDIEDFVQWLKKFNYVLLVAHNGSKFDFPVLLSAVSHINMLDDLMANVAGCLDSLTLFRKAFGNRGSYKQEDLARDILSIQYNAVEDVSTLVKLFKHSLTLVPDVLKFSCSIKAVQALSSSSEYS